MKTSDASSPECDLEMTLELFDVLKIPRESRDREWIEDFLEIVPNASLVALDPQIRRGPEGFPYLALGLPTPNEDFDAYSVQHAIPYCLQKGCGIVLFKDASTNEPEWIFPFGSLWSFTQYRNFLGDPDDRSPSQSDESSGNETGTKREVMISAPSEEFLPRFARSALSKFLKEAVGLAEARVAVVTDPQNKPTRSLMFTDLLPERFEKEEQFVQLMNAIRWFLPPTRGLAVAVPEIARYAGPL